MCGNTNQKRKLLKKHQIKESEVTEEKCKSCAKTTTRRNIIRKHQESDH